MELGDGYDMPFLVVDQPDLLDRRNRMDRGVDSRCRRRVEVAEEIADMTKEEFLKYLWIALSACETGKDLPDKAILKLMPLLDDLLGVERRREKDQDAL